MKSNLSVKILLNIVLLAFVFVGFISEAFGQYYGPNSNWYFGNGAGIKFCSFQSNS